MVHFLLYQYLDNPELVFRISDCSSLSDLRNFFLLVSWAKKIIRKAVSREKRLWDAVAR